jgi:hypothetical protein
MLFNGSTLPVSSDTIFQIVKLLNHYILHRLILSHDMTSHSIVILLDWRAPKFPHAVVVGKPSARD